MVGAAVAMLVLRLIILLIQDLPLTGNVGVRKDGFLVEVYMVKKKRLNGLGITATFNRTFWAVMVVFNLESWG